MNAMLHSAMILKFFYLGFNSNYLALTIVSAH